MLDMDEHIVVFTDIFDYFLLPGCQHFHTHFVILFETSLGFRPLRQALSGMIEMELISESWCLSCFVCTVLYAV